MEKGSRRGLLKSSAKAAAAAAGVALVAEKAQAQPKTEKRSPYPAPNPPPASPPMFSRAVAYGNMLFLSGVGYHKEGDIEVHTRGVLDELKKNLEDAGSSLTKCLKVTVLLAHGE